MTHLIKRTLAAITVFSLATVGLMLAGCGGGGGGLSSQTVNGTAAVGAPLSGQVSLKDSSSTPQTRTTVIAGDGTFAIDVTGMQAPFILQATGSASGTSYKLHSFAEGTGTANINPLSDAIVASAAGDDDASKSYDDADHDKLGKIKGNLAAAVDALLKKLQPLLQKYNAQNTNPITARYIANHLDLDGMFDNVKITVANGVLSIINAKTGAVIYNGKVTDIANGNFYPGNVPSTPAAPMAPIGVAAVGGAGQVTVSWTAVSNATSYNVYYATASGVTTATGTKIANATTLAAVPAPPTVPAVPTGVTATGGANQVTVSWSAASGATSYNLYYSTTTGVTTASGTKVAGVTSPYAQTGLAAGTTYYYIVTAVNSAGESAASAQASAATSAAAIDGAALYTQYCAGCHGALGSSAYQGATAAMITTGIANISGMKKFGATGSTPLSAAQIAAIAAALL